MIRIPNIKCPIDGDIKSIVRKMTDRDTKFKIYKKSIDARKKSDVHYVYTVDVESKNEDRFLKKIKGAVRVEYKPYEFPKAGPPQRAVVIAGSGPAGLMCGLILAKNGCKVIILERGKCVEERKKDVEEFWDGGKFRPESNVQFGEGGAGTFSDGKLNTGIKDIRIRTVLEEFHRHGAPEEILYNAKPHVGTDNLYNMVASMRKEIIALGGEVRFSSRLDGIIVLDNKICGAEVTENGDNKYVIDTDNIVLATGHSARDTFSMLKNSGVQMERKSFSVGARIEHFQEEINKSQYGEFYEKLGAADYKLAVHLPNGRGVYTFCMCPGGEVINASSEAGGIAVNGMSRSRRDGENSNSALLVSVEPDDLIGDDVLAGCALQRKTEEAAFNCAEGKVPVSTVGSFVFGKPFEITRVKPTVKPSFAYADFEKLFPKFISDSLKEGILLFDKKIKGFADESAVLTAPETRSSSPVRIVRGEDGQSLTHSGIYPCGEGAGYAGGIMSAATDGLKTAEALLAGI